MAAIKSKPNGVDVWLRIYTADNDVCDLDMGLDDSKHFPRLSTRTRWDKSTFSSACYIFEKMTGGWELTHEGKEKFVVIPVDGVKYHFPATEKIANRNRFNEKGEDITVRVYQYTIKWDGKNDRWNRKLAKLVLARKFVSDKVSAAMWKSAR